MSKDRAIIQFEPENQITLPEELVQVLNWEVGDYLEFKLEEGRFIVSKPEAPVSNETKTL